jgi:hypothetical protein
MNDVRADRFTAPHYNAIPASIRQAIEDRIPVGGYLSLTHGGHSFRARVYVGTVCIAESLPCSHVETAALQAVRRAEAAA